MSMYTVDEPSRILYELHNLLEVERGHTPHCCDTRYYRELIANLPREIANRRAIANRILRDQFPPNSLVMVGTGRYLIFNPETMRAEIGGIAYANGLDMPEAESFADDLVAVTA